ncbi:MAG: MFS transporter [Methylotenera sp.]|nr:MFS transporter [Oligoflexia bacterium]
MKSPSFNRLGILTATILGSSMVIMDSTVVNVILPRLQTEFQVSADQIQWVVEAYFLFLSALILLGGALGDRFGRKCIFQLGTVLFIAASLGCALAGSLLQLTVARALQGIGGALLTPGSLAIINATFPKAERGRAIGTWAGFSAITSALGPVLGGWLTEEFSWRSVFLLNLPLGLLTLHFARKFVPANCGESEKSGRSRLDYRGALTSTFGLAGITFGLIESSRLGFQDPRVFGSLGAGALLLAHFLWLELRTPSPLLPPELFRSRAFTGANFSTFLLYGALGGVFFFLPFNLIQVQGFTPTQAGAANLPFVLILFILSRWTGGFHDRYGPRYPLVGGSLIAGVGFLLLGFLPGLLAGPTGQAGYWSAFFPGLIVFGIGMSFCVSPLTTAVLESVPTEHSGVGSGINNAIARFAGLIAIAVMTLLILRSFKIHLKSELLHAPNAAILARASELAALDAPEARVEIRRAYLASFRELMGLSFLLALGSALCAFFTLKQAPPAARPKS